MTIEAGAWLRVEGLELSCTIGVTARERREKQRLVIDAAVRVDASAVARTDAIRDTVDYRLVARRITELAEASSFRLVEALAAHLAQAVLDEFPRVLAVRVAIRKPAALRRARAAGVVLVVERAPR